MQGPATVVGRASFPFSVERENEGGQFGPKLGGFQSPAQPRR